MGINAKTKFLIVSPVVILLVLNFLVSFTPELGFDALWYHLTLPKLWLLKKQWHFDGGLLYYSVMPRLTEIIYTPLIKYTGTVGPKLVQFFSALGTSYLIFLSVKNLKLKQIWGWAAVSLFYCTWLVSWESSSAYIDLFRGLLEMVAIYQIIFGSWLVGAIFLGLAIGTKWLALGSLAIFTFVFGRRVLIPALVIALPWFLIAYHYTGNFIYPIFSKAIDNGLLHPLITLKHLLVPHYYLTFPFDDFISPLVGIIFLLSIWSLTYNDKNIKKIAMVGILGSLSTLFINPPSARFLIAYLPALIISSVFVISHFSIKVQNIFIVLVIISSLFVLSLRLIAFKKYIPFLTGLTSTQEFLTTHSNRLPGAFIDSDLYVAQHLSNKDSILIDKLHNLYYFPYNFDHTSWANTSTKYDYLITQGVKSVDIAGELIHQNDVGIQIFKLNR